MKTKPLRSAITTAGIYLAITLANTANSATPLWTFEPLTPTTVTLEKNGKVIVEYRITNQTARSQTLVMQPIPGVTQITTGVGSASNPFVLGPKGSVILRLEIDASQLSPPITGGPVICQQGNPNQCYQPSSSNSLRLTVTEPPAPQTASSQEAAQAATQATTQAVNDAVGTSATNAAINSAINAARSVAIPQ